MINFYRIYPHTPGSEHAIDYTRKQNAVNDWLRIDTIINRHGSGKYPTPKVYTTDLADAMMDWYDLPGTYGFVSDAFMSIIRTLYRGEIITHDIYVNEQLYSIVSFPVRASYLDHKRSQIQWLNRQQCRAISIDDYVFEVHDVLESELFTIKELLNVCFVTGIGAEIIKRNGMKGIAYEMVYSAEH